ncbi:MAG: hypothetical protein P4L79_13800 [Legionella sp.]|uniref:hypothetical protein n=1 Tax=Legionella sp. TaxID=459 RepID=UPI00283DF938|nr:hypothetical protein [Legionella sp.]
MTSHIQDDTPTSSSDYKQTYQQMKRTPAEQLIVDIEAQLRSIEGKGASGGTHEQKRAVLNEALSVLKNEPGHDSSSLKAVMDDNPKYDRGFSFRSATGKLLDRVLELTEQPNTPSLQ